MIDIDAWLNQYVSAVRSLFGNRVWFIGMQGSYGRGEASEKSDIDVVLILDSLTAGDIAAYRSVLDGLDHRGLICGFLSGREELLRWEPSDLFQFCHDTTPVLGSLDEVLKKVDPDAVRRAVRIGACNIYHGCVHNMLFEKSPDILRGLFKSATFVIRAAVYGRTQRFCRSLADLTPCAEEKEQKVIAAYKKMISGAEEDFDDVSELLFSWAQGIITASEGG